MNKRKTFFFIEMQYNFTRVFQGKV